jgi:hypothetical protein
MPQTLCLDCHYPILPAAKIIGAESVSLSSLPSPIFEDTENFTLDETFMMSNWSEYDDFDFISGIVSVGENQTLGWEAVAPLPHENFESNIDEAVNDFDEELGEFLREVLADDDEAISFV